MKDKLAEDHRYAAVIEKRKNEPTVSLDDYLAKRSKQMQFRAAQPSKVN